MLAPVVRGGAAGVRALLKRAHGRGVRGSLANAAERFLRRQVELEDASPFDAAPAARAEHAARMSEAQVVQRLQAEIERDMRRRRRMRLRQSEIEAGIRARVAVMPDQVDRAMYSVLEFDPTNYTGPSVAQRVEAAR